MCENKFVFLDHTSDVYVAAYGKTLEEAFENAALAMFEAMTDTSKVKPKEKYDVEIEEDDLQALLYSWLEELLYAYGAHGLVFSVFKVYEIRYKNNRYILKGEACGEEYDSKRHESRVEVKAVTYSLMSITRQEDLYEVRVVFDI